MAEDHVWSTSLGRWFGIPVRVHFTLLLCFAAVFGGEWHFREFLDGSRQGTALVTCLVLLGSIIAHELGHLFAISNLGGNCNGMLLTPWGGNSDYTLPSGGKSRALIHMAGPFINGIIFLFGATVLIRHGGSSFDSVISPFHPHAFQAAQWERSLLEMVTWINFQLLIINMLPCFPFDAAAAIRAGIDSMHLDVSRHRIESAIMAMGHGLAFTMIGVAWLLRNYTGGSLQPAWFIFLIGGIVLAFAARYSFARETAYDDADWDGLLDGAEYDSMYEGGDFFHFGETDENGSYSQWLLEKQHARESIDQELEAVEEQRADDILVKLHDSGIDALTDEERTILDRVSARLRARRESGV